MPQDPDLYGRRPVKKAKRDVPLTMSMDFTAQLTTLMSNSASNTSRARPRPPKEGKSNLLKDGREKKSAKKDDHDRLVLKEVTRTEDEAHEQARAKRRMEDKARVYAAMKRGDYVPKDNEAAPLVDFDRKWAEEVEGKAEDLTSSSEEGADDAAEIVEYEDEFGRLRTGVKADKEKMERRARRGMLGAEELERMSARPGAPSNLIYGDAVQAMAFNPDDPDKMQELARKRDRSATPPEAKHYDANWEVRTKGTGFYQFSKDEEARTQEMKNLEEERLQTEKVRLGREEQRDARRQELEQRRKEMTERKAKRQADNFLDDL